MTLFFLGMPPAPGYNRNDQVLDFTGSVTLVSSIYLWLEGVAIYRKRGQPGVSIFSSWLLPVEVTYSGHS